MRFPENLPQGGTIGFVAPSFGCSIEPYKSGFENAQKKFRAMGYQLALGPNCYAAEGIGISNTPAKCARELEDAYCDTASDVLISCGGGELMCEILPDIDFERIKAAKPKWYMGYSDNTNFTYLLATICDTASVYGPCAAAFGMEPWHPSITDALGVLTGETTEVTGYEKWEKESLKNEENPLAPYHVTEPRKLRVYQNGILYGDGADQAEAEPASEESEGKPIPAEDRAVSTGNLWLEPFAQMPQIHVQGRLLGGCMDCLVTLAGTRFDHTKEFIEKYKEDGILWFLEACDLNVFGIRRAMWQMEEAGWFAHVKGFLIGRPRVAQEMMGLDAYDAVLKVAGEKNVPVIMDVDLGHLPPMMPVIVGSYGILTVQGNDIRLRMEQI